MNNYRDELKRITKILLEPGDDYDKLPGAIKDLNELFLKITALKIDSDECREDIYLPEGKAIGTTWASACVKELLRTKRFITGLYKGIKAAQEKFPGEIIHVLYAGTGPFATLAVPLTTVFSSKEVNFTFLEINPISIDALKNVIKTFEIENYVREIVKCDATTYKVNKDRPVHIVITETMQNALKKEPQVAITMNLVPQLEEGGILIPENIVIDAVILSMGKVMEKHSGLADPNIEYCRLLGRIFELNKSTPIDYPVSEENGAKVYSFPEVKVEFPDSMPEEYRQLCLMTTIQVFGDELLTHWQCSLNLPHKLMNIDWEKNTIRELTFQYEVGENPGFQYK